MPAQTIVDNWDSGCSLDELAVMWDGITREQIEGILRFARPVIIPTVIARDIKTYAIEDVPQEVIDALEIELEALAHCSICKRALDVQDDLLSQDCGGDCLGCMIDIEDGQPAPDLPQAELNLWLDKRDERMRLLWEAAAPDGQ